jgi:hypothetical protein
VTLIGDLVEEFKEPVGDQPDPPVLTLTEKTGRAGRYPVAGADAPVAPRSDRARRFVHTGGGRGAGPPAPRGLPPRRRIVDQRQRVRGAGFPARPGRPSRVPDCCRWFVRRHLVGVRRTRGGCAPACVPSRPSLGVIGWAPCRWTPARTDAVVGDRRGGGEVTEPVSATCRSTREALYGVARPRAGARGPCPPTWS